MWSTYHRWLLIVILLLAGFAALLVSNSILNPTVGAFRPGPRRATRARRAKSPRRAPSVTYLPAIRAQDRFRSPFQRHTFRARRIRLLLPIQTRIRHGCVGAFN